MHLTMLIIGYNYTLIVFCFLIYERRWKSPERFIDYRLSIESKAYEANGTMFRLWQIHRNGFEFFFGMTALRVCVCVCVGKVLFTRNA